MARACSACNPPGYHELQQYVNERNELFTLVLGPETCGIEILKLQEIH
jgi:hypothetical protein